VLRANAKCSSLLNAWYRNDVTRMNGHHRPSPPHPVADGPGATRALRALVVDDNRDAADSLVILLRLAGHEARAAYDGPSALRAAEECRPDAAFLELRLAGLDGKAVAARLRETGELRGLILVAVTGWGGAEVRRRAAEAGFDHFFLKPVGFVELGRVKAGVRQAAGQTAAV